MCVSVRCERKFLCVSMSECVYVSINVSARCASVFVCLCLCERECMYTHIYREISLYVISQLADLARFS